METEYQEPLTEVYEHERTEVIETVLKTIRARPAFVLKKHIYEGQTLVDIAKELGISC